MRKSLIKKIYVLLFAGLGLVSACFTGCKKDEEPNRKAEEGTYMVYCLDESEMELASEAYMPVSDEAEVEELVDELFYAMLHPSDADGHKTAVPASVEDPVWRLGDEMLSVYFPDSYNSLPISDEVMFRAAYVKTMTQIPGVKYVCFYVNQQPLMDAEGSAVGIMLASDFVENIGTTIYRTWVELSMYYANAKGDGLVSERITVGYGKNASLERVIIDQLIKGPVEEGHIRTVPASLTLLSVSTKEGTCYVDFGGEFSDMLLPVSPAVTIYSIVNSLCELSNVNKVQISVRGSSILFRDSIDLSQPLERNLDMMDTQ